MTTPYLTPPVFSWPAAPGGKLHTYQAGGNTPQATYSDAAGVTPNTNPVTLDSLGSAVVRLAVGVAYHVVLKDPTDVTTIWDADNIDNAYLTSSGVTAAIVGAVLYPQTAAEVTAGITPTYYFYPQGNVLRYGIVPNNAGAAAANSVALKSLGNPQVTGPTGRVVFPNTTGADIYYFSDIAHQFRPGMDLDLCGTTLNFTKTYSAGTDDAHGFIEAISNFACRNGTITVSYVGGGANNAGPAIRLGSRRAAGGSGYPFGSYASGIFDQDDNVFMGKIDLTNLTINSNCTSAPVIWMIGGLDGVRIENCAIDGALGQGYAIAYEYGFSSANGAPVTGSSWSSSHMRNGSFRNLRLTNFKTTATGAGALDLGGAYDCTVENLFVDTCYTALQFRVGEALYYRPWSRDATGVKPAHMMARNITAQNCGSTAIVLAGSQSSGSSYLSAVITALGHPADYIAQTDLIHSTLDGFAVSGSGAGIALSGPATICNGVVSASSNGISIQDECCWFDINNVRILNSSGIGIRGTIGSAIFSPARLKMGQIRNSKICGCVTNPAITLQNCRDVLIEANQLGFNTIWDAAAEATQTFGVSVDGATNGGGVTCRANYVTTAAGNGYNLAGTIAQINATCSVEKPRGNAAVTGPWDIDGVMQASATTIADKTSYVNNLNGAAGITNKYVGRMCYDTTNTRLMIAQGSGATSNWIRADGAATVTPA